MKEMFHHQYLEHLMCYEITYWFKTQVCITQSNHRDFEGYFIVVGIVYSFSFV